MNVMITVDGKRKSGRTTLLNWLMKELENKGANIVVDNNQHTMLLTAEKGFLTPVQQTEKEIGGEVPLSLLQQAHNVIHGDREKTYGDPSKNLRNIAAYWSIHLSASLGEKISLTEQDVCVMMILLKQARLINSPGHHDSLMDTAGYAALADIVGVSGVAK